jgi:hypothetical protein
MAKCLICSCTFTPSNHSAGKYCSQHCYQSAPKQRIPSEVRFWRQVRKTAGCWLWTGTVTPDGYGHLVLTSNNIQHRTYARVHRFSWELHFGPIPDGLHVCHHCDNPGCVRPDHLFLGTNLMNVRDSARKGRHRNPDNRGSKHGMSKLTEATVKEIKTLGKAYGVGRLAARFNVSAGAISMILSGQRWAHV